MQVLLVYNHTNTKNFRYITEILTMHDSLYYSFPLMILIIDFVPKAIIKYPVINITSCNFIKPRSKSHSVTNNKLILSKITTIPTPILIYTFSSAPPLNFNESNNTEIDSKKPTITAISNE